MAHSLAVRPSSGPSTWTVIDADYRTVAPVEEWLEAHRCLWSPNTVRGYATALAQWWTFLEQRGESDCWRDVGVPATTGFLSWLRNGRTVEHAVAAHLQQCRDETVEAAIEDEPTQALAAERAERATAVLDGLLAERVALRQFTPCLANTPPAVEHRMCNQSIAIADAQCRCPLETGPGSTAVHDGLRIPIALQPPGIFSLERYTEGVRGFRKEWGVLPKSFQQCEACRLCRRAAGNFSIVQFKYAEPQIFAFGGRRSG